MAAKFSSKVAGVPDIKRKFKALPEIARNHYGEAGFETAKAIVPRARRRVRVRYGILRDHIAASYSKRTGVALVGVERTAVIVGNRKIVPGRYAHLVEFKFAHPFMRPSAEEERKAFLDRIRAKHKLVEADVRKA